MYKTEYFDEFATALALPAESIGPLKSDYEKILASEAGMEAMQAAGEKLFAGEDWEAMVPEMDKIAAATGLHRHTVDFLFLMAQSERLMADYDAKGLSRALFWDTIADLKYKLIECHDVYGIWGTFVAFWHPWFYTLRRFKLGRLQFEPIPYEGEAVTLQGHTLKPGDTALNVHIPSCGALTRAACEDAYKKAYDFYKDMFGTEVIPFICHSWLLFPKNREILPATSNILGFMDDFYIVKPEEYEEFHDKWRVFGKDAEKPDADLPEDTSMRRAFKRWLLAGKRTGAALGVFFFDGKTFIR